MIQEVALMTPDASFLTLNFRHPLCNPLNERIFTVLTSLHIVDRCSLLLVPVMQNSPVNGYRQGGGPWATARDVEAMPVDGVRDQRARWAELYVNHLRGVGSSERRATPVSECSIAAQRNRPLLVCTSIVFGLARPN